MSTDAKGLDAVVKAAIAAKGTDQKVPYNEGHVDLTDKAAVEESDRKRFEFVNGVVASPSVFPSGSVTW